MQRKVSLKPQRPIEANRDWSGINSPYDLAVYIARLLTVEISGIDENELFTVQPLEPTGSDRSKIWIKSEGVFGIGLPIGGSYYMIYQYVPNTPFLWVSSDQPPGGIRALTESELTKYGLTNPSGAEYWVIFTP